GRSRAGGANDARQSARATGGRRVLRRVAALRSRARLREGPPPLSGVHTRARGNDGAGNPPASRSSRLGRRQLHGSVHGRLQLPEFRPLERLWRTGAVRRIRARELPRRITPRGTPRPGIVSVVERRTGRDVSDGARNLRARAVPLSARAESAA